VRLSFVEADGAWTLRPRASLVDPVAAAFVTGAVHPDGATVSAQQAGTEVASTRTDADGTFRLGPLPAGTYALVVTAPRSVPEVRRDLALRAGETSAGHLFALAPAAPGGVAAGSAPPGSLVVRLLRDGALVALTGVALDGDYSFAALPPGTYEVEFHDAHGLVGTDRLVVSARGW
jgi:hypothetical protein